ncbi:hypothetical protein ATTO_11760 [Leptogranulimonas caecicola]|uniref:Uncharacterized protein n=1 Tax=Leptogranulimonas caecicola TaxID=2894156 RepID=A0AAU9CCK8_9ACTN|nr:hypothetical protein ATTO_11760 [Leptogranulimonas caecicola]
MLILPSLAALACPPLSLSPKWFIKLLGKVPRKCALFVTPPAAPPQEPVPWRRPPLMHLQA